MNEQTENLPSLQRGAEIIRSYVKTLPLTPGVYRMISGGGEVLYVGKAKALKNRVTSYTHVDKLPRRLQRMVSDTHTMEFVHTHTEVEALLLESNLIKKLKPRFNILLRDDKSFPYILIPNGHDFPQIKKHRGVRKGSKAKGGGEYFGPFANAGAVNRTLEIMQRVFKIRNCTDSVFSNRDRPCLQYHIKRCTAPCVAMASQEEYAGQIDQARQFLSGKSREIQAQMAKVMQQASEAENFELAAELRDRIRTLSAIQSSQDINLEGLGDVDVMALSQEEDKSCIQVFFFRGGQNFGNRAYFPRHSAEDKAEDIMSVFMAQFYENKPVPKTVYLNYTPTEKDLLQAALTSKRELGNVKIMLPQRGKAKRLVEFVARNATDALKRYLIEQSSTQKYLKNVADLFKLEAPPTRIEVYDNSHIAGTNMVGAMVVAGTEGFNKAAYRKFNIKDSIAGDDYGMMREVMKRRFGRALKENIDKQGDDWPDILLIDGGKGQFSAVKEALQELGIYDDLFVVGISKHEGRHAGREQFFVDDAAGNLKPPFQLPIHDPTLHYLQRLRDEVHRFAIGAHRTRRKNDISKSPLDQITGIGAKRKKALLLHFGSAKDVGNASIADLMSVEGISKAVAEKIYNYFH